MRLFSASALRASAGFLGACLLSLPPANAASEDDWLKPIGQGKRGSPQRVKGGESFPPLPLPATPLRRTEFKREPTPPMLVGKVVWGAAAEFDVDGSKVKVEDWNMCPEDIQVLLRKAERRLGVAYGSEPVRLSEFDGDPAKTPVLFWSGGRSVKMTDEQVDALRRYIDAGGMVWADSIAGSPYFVKSVRAVVERAFPGESLRPIPLDHPVFHLAQEAGKVRYPRGAKGEEPLLLGLYRGSRVGLVLSPYGMGAGWANLEPERFTEGAYYDPPSATAVGLNLVAYAVGYARLGAAHARPELLATRDKGPATDQLVFAQVRYNGVWNTDPGGPGNLLRALATETNVRLSFKREVVDLGRTDLANAPFLYFSGCYACALPAAEAVALKAYIAKGGTVLFDNSLGLEGFDLSVRALLKRILPDKALKRLAADHPVYAAPYAIREVSYTPAVEKAHPGARAPLLEGIESDGAVRVFYSRYDLGGGWQGDDHPLSKGYARADALRLGMNIVAYSMTH